MEPLPFCVYKKGTVEKLFFLDKCYENSIMVDIGSIIICTDEMDDSKNQLQKKDLLEVKIYDYLRR